MNERSRREVVGRVAGFYKEGRDDILLEEEDEVYDVERVVEMKKRKACQIACNNESFLFTILLGEKGVFNFVEGV